MRDLKQRVLDSLTYNLSSLREIATNAGTSDLLEVGSILQEFMDEGVVVAEQQKLSAFETFEKGLRLDPQRFRWMYSKA